MESRRYHVMQVAQRLFIEKGFTQTSIQDIIVAANISKGTFYNYFASKNECLIAMLKHAQKEAYERRNQLLIDKPKNDRMIFSKQIVIRMQVNREQNLLPLLGFVFHSRDKELRQFAKTYHLHEVAWLSERFIDVYGKDIYPYAIDCAVFVLGLTQQYSLIWSFYVTEDVNTEELVKFILERMNGVVANFLEKQESFIHEQLFSQVESIWQNPREGNNVILLLKQLWENDLSEDKIGLQYINFIIDEISKEEPRIHLLQSVLQSLHVRYKTSDHAVKINELKKRLTEKYL